MKPTIVQRKTRVTLNPKETRETSEIVHVRPSFKKTVKETFEETEEFKETSKNGINCIVKAHSLVSQVSRNVSQSNIQGTGSVLTKSIRFPWFPSLFSLFSNGGGR